MPRVYNHNIELHNEILRLAALPGGFMTSDLGDRWPPKHVQYRTYALRAEGKLFSFAETQRKVRYFTTAEAAKTWGEAFALRRRGRSHQKKEALRVDKAAQAIVPAGFKVTICPPYVGRWERQDPGERVISADWNQRRQQEQQEHAR